MTVLLNHDLKKADPKRAKECLSQLRKGVDGLALRLWPCLTHARTITTGSMAFYTDRLRKTYMKGNLLLAWWGGVHYVCNSQNFEATNYFESLWWY